MPLVVPQPPIERACIAPFWRASLQPVPRVDDELRRISSSTASSSSGP
jgi:hypothetical protein